VVNYKSQKEAFGEEVRLQAYFAGSRPVRSLKDEHAEILYARTGLQYHKTNMKQQRTAIVSGSVLRFMQMWEISCESPGSDDRALALAEATCEDAVEAVECQICKRQYGSEKAQTCCPLLLCYSYLLYSSYSY
jgi:hypothetical protein